MRFGLETDDLSIEGTQLQREKPLGLGGKKVNDLKIHLPALEPYTNYPARLKKGYVVLPILK